ncbi:peptidase [[Phormidium] sp. ETS-05]|uniref:peptidase n=1 Tax=[Phormidium] sp. ETS-05 TaxID=222819 RepID=UPI0018EEFB71|nr:peptidase [[Phormidium] sp. ETS-05]
MNYHKIIGAIILAICTGFLVIFLPLHRGAAHWLLQSPTRPLFEVVANQDNAPFPVAKPHSLPPTLAAWEDSSGDYFEAVTPLDVGYLVWSRFPIRVYVQQPKPDDDLSSFENQTLTDWAMVVGQVVNAWNVYLPLELVETPEMADIMIWRRRPPLRLSETGEILRARSAETRYELILIGDRLPILSHKCNIFISPTQKGKYLAAAALHELGHALGIWGHSPLPEDTMYFAQVASPPPISRRDVNTLKRVYEQPTRLGWPLDGNERR